MGRMEMAGGMGMSTPDPDDPFACGCDVDAPICACLPLWVETPEPVEATRAAQD